jgi:hypothetical protein
MGNTAAMFVAVTVADALVTVSDFVISGTYTTKAGATVMAALAMQVFPLKT